jgi:hypothetical protein
MGLHRKKTNNGFQERLTPPNLPFERKGIKKPVEETRPTGQAKKKKRRLLAKDNRRVQ